MVVEAPALALTKPSAVVLKAPGTNCDAEMKYALELAGADATIIPIHQVENGAVTLADKEIVVGPGGFSFGDHLGSGEVFAAHAVSSERFADELLKHAAVQRKPSLWVCNGMQEAVRMGLVPDTLLTTLDNIAISMAPNESGHFEHRWIALQSEQKSACVFDLPDEILHLPVAHGEGRVWMAQAMIEEIEQSGLVVLRYVDERGAPTQVYPDNPNGSMHAIAGMCNRGGNVLVLMPHPERYAIRTQHPKWRTLPKDAVPDGLKLIQSIVDYAADIAGA